MPVFPSELFSEAEKYENNTRVEWSLAPWTVPSRVFALELYLGRAAVTSLVFR